MDICGESAVPVEERAAAVQDATLGLDENGIEKRVVLEKKWDQWGKCLFTIASGGRGRQILCAKNEAEVRVEVKVNHAPSPHPIG
jgi:hypothetical protein